MSENFNYISFGDWDLVGGDTSELAMSRGRMFEYTPTDIEKRLENLGPEAITFLEKLPTFVCSEARRDSSGASMLIKYGHVDKIRADKNEVVAQFTTLLDFGEVDFADMAEASELFDTVKFELYRTHWAVRDGDPGAILAKLAEKLPDLSDAIQKLQVSASPVGKPPPRNKNIIGVAGSVEEFLAHLYKHQVGADSEVFFRGHDDEKFELTPTVLRKLPEGEWEYLHSEDRLCKELLIGHYDEFEGDQYCFDRLVRMQHYGLPTRLLDISSNPLVALFFACYGNGKIKDVDGEVIVFRINASKVKYYDSDTVSCLANLSNLSFLQKDELDLTLDQKKFNKLEVARKLLHHIRSEKGYFEGRIIPDDLRSILCVKAKRTNTRIKSQSGAFLLFGHEVILPESGDEAIDIARITITDKENVLRQLDAININATTVYPSIDQTTVHLRNRYKQSAPS